MNEVTATTEPAPPDTRPAPPPGFPTHYILTWWEWKYNEWGREWKWHDCQSMFPRSRMDVLKEAAELQAKDCRCIRIITIPGEEPRP